MKILIADDEKLTRAQLERPLSESHEVILAASYREATELLDRHVFNLAFIDLNLDNNPEKLTGPTLIQELRMKSPTVVLIAMTGLDDPELIAKCFRLGASDFVIKPILPKTMGLIMCRAMELHRLLRNKVSLQAQAGNRAVTKRTLTSKAPSYQRVIETLKKLKGTQDGVLLRGESGVGKEIAVEFLWSQEQDDDRAFIPLLCGGITPSLVESELFGHKKGSFSGADVERIGKIEAADGGDLFLDEVATLPMEMQIKLLRFLSKGEITPVGQNIPKIVSCRVIAATNEPLEEMVKAKTFREDLYFRLKKITITIPPLRERREDIPDLIAQFLSDVERDHKKLSDDALRFCMEYRWPGNVRELEDAIQAAALLADEDTISRSDIESQVNSDHLPDVLADGIPLNASTDMGFTESAVAGNFNKLSREFEQRLVRHALSKSKSETAAAKLLGLHKNTLQSKRRKWGWNNI